MRRMAEQKMFMKQPAVSCVLTENLACMQLHRLAQHETACSNKHVHVNLPKSCNVCIAVCTKRDRYGLYSLKQHTGTFPGADRYVGSYIDAFSKTLHSPGPIYYPPAPPTKGGSPSNRGFGSFSRASVGLRSSLDFAVDAAGGGRVYSTHSDSHLGPGCYHTDLERHGTAVLVAETGPKHTLPKSPKLVG